jgi:hypothetical protein
MTDDRRESAPAVQAGHAVRVDLSADDGRDLSVRVTYCGYCGERIEDCLCGGEADEVDAGEEGDFEARLEEAGVPPAADVAEGDPESD